MVTRVRERGSRRWAAWIAELTAWANVGLITLVLYQRDLPRETFLNGVLLVGAAAGINFFVFRFIRPRAPHRHAVAWLGAAAMLAVSTGAWMLMRGLVPASEVVFVPALVIAGLLGNLRTALAATVVVLGVYLGGSYALEQRFANSDQLLYAFVFVITGVVSGLLARELHLHYRGEREEHRLATAVRHRLLAVLDAVDEAVLFSDRQGIARIVNKRAAMLFEMQPDDYLGLPVANVHRALALCMENPDEFMETLQGLRDQPEVEFRSEIEQILPARRQLRLYSGPARDESGAVIGRIDVYTDISESVRRAAEVEQLYEQARQTAESYQRSLLPESVPALPRVNLVAHYVPATGRRMVRGDFFDFVPLADGRVGFVVGDVCGSGPAAANDAALTRYTLRSLAIDDRDPGTLLRKVNLYIQQTLGSERFVRLIFGVLDPERAVFEYANAGHVAPAVFRFAKREVEWLEEGGIALAVDRESDYKVGRIELQPGDMLVLYTDGLTEARRMGSPFGRDRFGELVQQYGVGTPGELVQALRRAAEAWSQTGDLEDDLALVVFQVIPDREIDEPVRELIVPNEIARAPDVRRFVAAFLADLRAPVDISSEILIAVGEAAANASRHGRAPGGRSECRVRCALEGNDVIVVIADDGPGFDLSQFDDRAEPDPLASGGRGLFLMRRLMDEATIEPTPQGTTVRLRRRLRT